MRTPTDEVPNDPPDDHWSPWMGLLRATGCCVVVGLVMGLVFYALSWWLQDTIRSYDVTRAWRVRYLSPADLPFLAAALLFGWGGFRLAERVSGLHGFVLMIPMIGSLAIAVGLGLGLSQATIEPWSDHFWKHFYLPVTVGTLAVVAYKAWRSQY